MRNDARHDAVARDALAALWQDSSEHVVAPARFATGTQEIEPHDDGEMLEEHVVQIVHDLKNPLSAIGLEACVLFEGLDSIESDEARAILRRIQHNVTYLDRLVHDILDSCLIETGHIVLRRAPTEMCELLARVIDRAVPTRARGRVVLEASQRATIAIDDLRIERVIANLVSNALKYAPAASRVVVRLDVHHGGITVSVIDAGTSLSRHDRETLFEKYRRGSTSAGREGMGLGLYVSRRIVEAHGGRIDVERVHGIGTRFYFDLPW